MRRTSNFKQNLSSKPFSVRRKERHTKNRLIVTTVIIIFLLYCLFIWIIPALIGGLSFFNKLKPTQSPQPAISESASLAPPVLNIPYEATNTASITIRGYASAHSKVEIYVDDDLKDTVESDENGGFKAESIDLTLGTNNIYGKTVDEKGTKSLPSKSIRITYSNEKPKLEISTPDDNKEIVGGDKKVTVSGSTNPGNNVSVNGTRVIVTTDGNFSHSLEINEGDNQITIQASDQTGNTTQLQRKVIYKNS